MHWEEIKSDNQQVYPTSSLSIFMMPTESGKPATHWVDKAYQNYPFKKECPFNCYVSIDFTEDFNTQKEQLDIVEIENYFRNQLRSVCVCHLIARVTTDNGINLELYVDNVEQAIEKLNEMEADINRLVDFNCEINDDENWDNVAEILD
jgi:hypothetical protein